LGDRTHRARLPRWLLAITGPGTLIGVAFGWIVWSSTFVLLYAVMSLGCMFGWNDARAGGANLLTIVLVALWVGHLAILGALLAVTWRARPPGDDHGTGAHRLLSFATRVGYASALIATAWLGFPILLLAPCA
jgi:hypothetical protein